MQVLLDTTWQGLRKTWKVAKLERLTAITPHGDAVMQGCKDARMRMDDEASCKSSKIVKAAADTLTGTRIHRRTRRRNIGHR